MIIVKKQNYQTVQFSLLKIAIKIKAMDVHGSGQRHTQFTKAAGPAPAAAAAVSTARGGARAPGTKSAPNGAARGGQPRSAQHRVTSRAYHSAVRCTVESCRSRMNEPHKLFYPIPTAPATRKIWTDLIRRHNLSSGSIFTNYVCSDHFSADQKLQNGHLKGNAIPIIFNVQRRPVVDCLYCGMSFDNRGRLHSHDSTMHLHESRRWKLECETECVPQGSLFDGKSECRDCSKRREVYKQMDELRRDIQQSTTELHSFAQIHHSGRLRLDLPTPCDETFSLADDKTQTSKPKGETCRDMVND